MKIWTKSKSLWGKSTIGPLGEIKISESGWAEVSEEHANQILNSDYWFTSIQEANKPEAKAAKKGQEESVDGIKVPYSLKKKITEILGGPKALADKREIKYNPSSKDVILMRVLGRRIPDSEWILIIEDFLNKLTTEATEASNEEE